MHGVGGGGKKRTDDAQPHVDRWVAYRQRASRLPHNTWRIATRCGRDGLRVEGGTVRASQQGTAKPAVIKGPSRRRGWVREEGCWSYLGSSPWMSQMPRPFGSRGGAGRPGSRGPGSPWRSQQRSYYRRDRWSPGRTEREAERQDACARDDRSDRSQPREGPGGEDRRVKPEGSRPERSDHSAQGDTAAHPAEASLWEQLLARGNLAEALRRVEQNAGAPGIDGMSTEELRPWLHDHWPQVHSALEAGTYRPQPVRRVMIPKPSGGQRMLGVPAAVDRLICQAIAQVLTPIFDPQFHPHSFGFRPGRSQHHAVERARQFIYDLAESGHEISGSPVGLEAPMSSPSL